MAPESCGVWENEVSPNLEWSGLMTPIDRWVFWVPHTHGDHIHIGQFTVSTRDASGLSNPAVWTALERKGLARRDGPIAITLTAEGVSYDTGFGDRFLVSSDH